MTFITFKWFCGTIGLVTQSHLKAVIDQKNVHIFYQEVDRAASL